MTLYDLTAEYMQILEMAEDGVDPEIIATHLEDIGGAIEEKADSIAAVMTSLAGTAKVIKDEEARLAARRRSVENNIEKLKRYLEKCMRTTGKIKFKTALHTFYIRNNKPSLRLIEGKVIPVEYLIAQAPIIDKDRLYNDLQAEKDVECAELYNTSSLIIR